MPERAAGRWELPERTAGRWQLPDRPAELRERPEGRRELPERTGGSTQTTGRTAGVLPGTDGGTDGSCEKFHMRAYRHVREAVSARRGPSGAERREEATTARRAPRASWGSSSTPSAPTRSACTTTSAPTACSSHRSATKCVRSSSSASSPAAALPRHQRLKDRRAAGAPPQRAFEASGRTRRFVIQRPPAVVDRQHSPSPRLLHKLADETRCHHQPIVVSYQKSNQSTDEFFGIRNRSRGPRDAFSPNLTARRTTAAVSRRGASSLTASCPGVCSGRSSGTTRLQHKIRGSILLHQLEMFSNPPSYPQYL